MATLHPPLGRARRLPLPSPAGGPNWWLVAGVAIVGVAAMLPVLQNSTATSEGFGAQRYQAQEDQLNAQISVLESDLAQLTSLDRIQRRATELGLGPGQNPIYVTVDVPGPAPAKLPAEYLPTALPKPQVAPAPWWEPLVAWIP